MNIGNIVREYWLKDVGSLRVADLTGMDVEIIEHYYEIFINKSREYDRDIPTLEIPPPPHKCTSCEAKHYCGHEEEEPQMEQVEDSGLSAREIQWWEFAEEVARHLRDYTVPQYGDVGTDEITDYTVADCVNHLSRYAKRYGKQSRDGQQELDFLKIAHYAQCAWEKHVTAEPDEEPDELVIVEKEMNELMDENGYFYVGMCNYTDGTTQYVYKRKTR